ncbi:hypothetical protein VU01_11423 [Candidatus Electrothrix marina]|jgi:hypothetical protein|uniref:Ribbon-helix-helix protein, copG family n=1 Tax=Candidatus Electrothrix marina TaxID=1859130 RepID=A0A3S3QRP0_9BACT|nr:hypothetical protein VT99_12562 [Candidatus Electrothrix marina]RWX51405.1 hypothetical protein VU01_11423 [Candidatus Electrothrix marina]
MVQAKFTVEEAQAQFLSNFKEYGFKDKSSMLRAAVEYFRKVIELKELKKSADLYAEIYCEDEGLQELTEAALPEWPE